MAMNFANEFKTEVDERFEQQSYSDVALGSAYEIGNNKSITIYDVPVAPLQNYTRHPATDGDRYGSAFELQASTYTLTMTQDKSFNTVIDRGDLIQSQMVMEANRFLSRELNQMVIPAYDAYVFETLGNKASAMGNLQTTRSTKNNAYEQFLEAQEHMGNNLVPTDGRVAICSYAFANLLKQDGAFMGNASDSAYQDRKKGEIGTVDGVRILAVPSNILPNGCSMLMTHPFAAIGPKQLYDYKIHDNPPGISGYKVEGRFIWDCFVLQNKANAIWYIGNSGVVRTLTVVASPSLTTGKTVVTIMPEAASGNAFYVRTGTTLSSITYGATTKPTGFSSAAIASGGAVTPQSGDTVLEVIEYNSTDGIVGYGKCAIGAGCIG